MRLQLCLLVSTTLTLAFPAFTADTRCPGVTIESTTICPDAAAMVGRMCLNPRFMRHFSENVQRFITYHECAHATGIAAGHVSIKGDEILADKTAFERAYAEGWMNAATIADICKTFGKDPESSTHPSAKQRCASLRKWFAEAEAKKAAS